MKLTKEIILDAIPVDARDGLVSVNEPDGSFGRYSWYVKFAPFSNPEAEIASNEIAKATGRRTYVGDAGNAVYVIISDLPKRD